MKKTFLVTLVMTVPNVELDSEEAGCEMGMMKAIRRRLGRPLQKLEGRYGLGISVSCLDPVLSSGARNV